MYTKEEKQKYFKDLRAEWEESKELADNDKVTQALFKERGLDVSYYSFYFTYNAMQAQGLSGYPYIDAKTFHGWKDAGYIVKKGQKSLLKGITWIKANGNKTDNDDISDDDGFLFPKMYHLFHKTQVEAL